MNSTDPKEKRYVVVKSVTFKASKNTICKTQYLTCIDNSVYFDDLYSKKEVDPADALRNGSKFFHTKNEAQKVADKANTIDNGLWFVAEVSIRKTI